jgi:hypothetical protein
LAGNEEEGNHQCINAIFINMLQKNNVLAAVLAAG